MVDVIAERLRQAEARRRRSVRRTTVGNAPSQPWAQLRSRAAGPISPSRRSLAPTARPQSRSFADLARREFTGFAEEVLAQYGYQLVRPGAAARPSRHGARPETAPPPRLVRVTPDYRRASGLRDILRQKRAFERGAFDALMMGNGDQVTGAVAALSQPGGLGEVGQRYRANLARQAAQTRYEREYRPIMRNSGELAGTVASLALPFGAFARGGAEVKGAATLARRELATLAGAGATGGILAQGAIDAATNRRTSLPDAAGAALGGAAAVGSLPLTFRNPGRAAAVDAWVTSVGQDVFNGRPISLERAASAAGTGRVAGHGTALAGRAAARKLNPALTRLYGEIIGEMRARLQTGRMDPSKTGNDALAYGYWRPDGWWGDRRFEYKGGPGAGLSPAQRRARGELGENFTYFHTLPDDLGRLSSVPSGWFVRPPGDRARR